MHVLFLNPDLQGPAVGSSVTFSSPGRKLKDCRGRLLVTDIATGLA
jgi:hypothetical protein